MPQPDELYLLKVDASLYWDRYDRPLNIAQLEQHLEKAKAIRHAAVDKPGGRNPLADSIFEKLTDRLEEKRSQTNGKRAA